MATKTEPKETQTVLEAIRLVPAGGIDSDISKLVESQKDSFPEPSEITIWEPFRDPFRFPEWCNFQEYEYAWLDKNDKRRELRLALQEGYWQFVTRSNHFRASSSDFRDHGAVERMDMILVYRPKSLGDRIRLLPELRHKEIVEASEETKTGDFYERTLEKGRGEMKEGAGGEVVYAQETAGEEGLITTGALK